MTTAVVHSDPEIMGGTPVFVGTRVPVRTLRDHLAGGDPLDVFLDDFPSVTREQAEAAVRLAFAPLCGPDPPFETGEYSVVLYVGDEVREFGVTARRPDANLGAVDQWAEQRRYRRFVVASKLAEDEAESLKEFQKAEYERRGFSYQERP